MKSLIVLSSLLMALPLHAAKLTNSTCKDVKNLNDKAMPEYLAVVDGYDKAGKKDFEEIDMVGIMNDATKVKEACANGEDAKIKDIRKTTTATTTAATTASPSTTTPKHFNPKNSKCEDFVALNEMYQPVAAYWVLGNSKDSKVKKGDLDEVYLEQPVMTLVEECRKQPKASFFSKAKSWFHKHV